MRNFSHFSNLNFLPVSKIHITKRISRRKKSSKIIFFFKNKIADFEWNNVALLKMLNYFFLEIPKEN